MFSKSLIVFSLLAVFASQGTFATNTANSKSTFGDLINQTQNVISELNSLSNGVLGDALSTLQDQISAIRELQNTFLNEGINGIATRIDKVLTFVTNITTEAGINITKCTLDTNKKLEALSESLSSALVTCLNEDINKALEEVQANIENVNKFQKQIAVAPVDLSKCLISLRPVPCIQNLLEKLTKLLTSIKNETVNIVTNSTKLIEKLPGQLGNCVSQINESATTETNAIIMDINKCVDDLILQISCCN